MTFNEEKQMSENYGLLWHLMSRPDHLTEEAGHEPVGPWVAVTQNRAGKVSYVTGELLDVVESGGVVTVQVYRKRESGTGVETALVMIPDHAVLEIGSMEAMEWEPDEDDAVAELPQEAIEFSERLKSVQANGFPGRAVKDTSKS